MNLLRLAFLHMKRMLKNTKSLVVMLLIPTLVISAVAFFTGGVDGNQNQSTVSINIVNQDKGNLGDLLIKELQNKGSFSISISNLYDARSAVTDEKSVAALVIPSDFTENIESGKAPSPEIIKYADNNMSFSLSRYLSFFIGERLLPGKALETLSNNGLATAFSDEEFKDKLALSIDDKKISLNFEEVKKQGTRTLAGSLSTNLIISFLMFSMIYITGEICELKRDRTLRRSLSTPNKNRTILGSIFLSMLMLCMLQVAILVLVTRFVFNIYWGSSPLALFLIFTAYLMVVLSLGLMLSRWVKNEAQASGIVNLVVMPTCMVSGCFMPLELLPKFFEKIAYFTPQYWTLDALNSIALKNSGVIDILPQVGVLLLFALAFLTAGAKSLQSMVKE